MCTMQLPADKDLQAVLYNDDAGKPYLLLVEGDTILASQPLASSPGPYPVMLVRLSAALEPNFFSALPEVFGGARPGLRTCC